MKQIINGKLYSTDSAEQKFNWDNGQEDFDEFLGESLYRTQSGEYFLWTSDNPAGEDELKLLNQDEAMDWLWRRDAKDSDIVKILEVEIA